MPLLRLWIFFCATLVAGGWLLSLAGILNPIGYLGLFAVFGLGSVGASRTWPTRERLRPDRLLRRLFRARRLLPLLFTVLALVLLLRGFILPPFHGDGLSYRIPRVLHWLFEEKWHWIDAQDPRLNTRGTVSEWLTAPILLFGRWDHLVFLPNWICFLFFPGLVFQVWRDWGVPSRLAWTWMWLLPAGFCYALQACNCSNDILASFFALAAFAFVRRGAPPRDVACSMLSFGLATGVKLTMAPLVIPWALLVLPHTRLVRLQPLVAGGVVAWALLVSALPTMVANYGHVGEPTGLSLEPLVLKNATPYLDRFEGNALILTLDNLTTPDLSQWLSFREALENSDLGQRITTGFEKDALYIYVYWSVEQEGLGPIVLAAGIAIFALTFRWGYVGRLRSRLTRRRLWLHVAMAALFLFFMATGTSVQPARLVSGYYPFLLSTCFVGCGVVAGWRRYLFPYGAVLALGAVIWIVTWSTNYPLLLPDGTLNTGEDAFERAQISYLGRLLPTSVDSIGLMRFWNEWENWAWKPYGSRQVYELPEDPAPAELARKHIRFIVITQEFLESKNETIDAWCGAHHAIAVGGLIAPNPIGYYVVDMNAPTTQGR